MTITTRQELQQRLFPNGIPQLWCPTLTHFKAAHVPDGARIAAHYSRLAAYVGGILVPGSTGEGWEMSDAEVRQLLQICLPAAHAAGMRVLIGVLKTETAQMIAALDALEELCRHPAVVGITVCPPRGADLTQSQIAAGLGEVLQRGIPTALYQLPQITQNEMEPQTVALLASEFPNFIMFKDTSGEDRVALSNVDLGGVFLVRGSERGGYAKWHRAAGGAYDGFLLSTANCFAPELSRMLALLDAGSVADAQGLSDQVEQVVTAAFELVKTFPVGNPFTNANKLLDHLLTYGEDATSVAPPLLISGQPLPAELIAEAARWTSLPTRRASER